MPSRKKRKQNKKNKDRRSLKERNKAVKKKDELAWIIAKYLTKQRTVWDKTVFADGCYNTSNKRIYCKDCQYHEFKCDRWREKWKDYL